MEQLGRFGAECTQLGVLCCPDTAGAGPMYVALLVKRGELLPVVGGQCKGLQALRLDEDDADDDAEEEAGEGGCGCGEDDDDL